jgi:hypothetical protein
MAQPVYYLEKMGYSFGAFSAEKLTLPDFLCIGAQKAGTTWLYENLKLHPQIFMPGRKELNYFSNTYRFYSYPLAYYAHYFAGSGNKLKGEATPCCNLPVKRIRFIGKIMPSVKLIIILRNPVDRLWAGALMHLVSGPKRKFEEFSEADFKHEMLKPDNLGRGFYPLILQNWRSVFPNEQLLIVFFDDLVNHPQQFLEQCFAFLGVDTHVRWEDFNLDVRFNKSPAYPMPENLRDYFFNIYKPSIVQLEKEFGSKVNPWLP